MEFHYIDSLAWKDLHAAIARSLFQIYHPGVERAKKALWALLRSYEARSSANLTVSTEKGKLKVVLEQSFDQHSNAHANTKAPKRISPSQLQFCNSHRTYNTLCTMVLREVSIGKFSKLSTLPFILSLSLSNSLSLIASDQNFNLVQTPLQFFHDNPFKYA